MFSCCLCLWFFVTLRLYTNTHMAMKNQDAEAKIASLKEELEKLRNENHNLKRRVKRMEERKESDQSERLRARTERNNRTEEVTKKGMDEIKKNSRPRA